MRILRAYGYGHDQNKAFLSKVVFACAIFCLSIGGIHVPTAMADPTTPPQPAIEEPVAEQPTGPLTVMPTAEYYTISGTVDDAKVVFAITVGDVTVTSAESQPVIAPEPNEAGAYKWHYTVPSTITAGEQQIKVAAATYAENGDVLRTLPEVSLALLLTVAPPPTPESPVIPVDPPKKDDTPLPVVTEPLPLTPQIGQFVAPEVGETTLNAPIITRTKLYGVPVGDLVQSSSAQRGSSVADASGSQGEVLGLKTASPLVDHATSSAALAPSSQGWQFFGVAWYWVVMVGVLFAVGFMLVIRAVLRSLRAVLPERSLASS